MWVNTIPWETIGQSAASEAVGSLVATGFVAAGGWLRRRSRQRRQTRQSEHAAGGLPQPSEGSDQVGT
jgi:hypothetical protein